MYLTRRSLIAASATLPFLRLPSLAQGASKVLRFGLSSYPPSLQPLVHGDCVAGDGRDVAARDAEVSQFTIAQTAEFGDGATIFTPAIEGGEKVRDQHGGTP